MEINRQELIKGISDNQPDVNDNNWFRELSKQTQIDFILNQNGRGEINLENIKSSTLIEVHQILINNKTVPSNKVNHEWKSQPQNNLLII